MKECFVLRSVPGAGKTKVAKIIAGEYGIVCEADEFMYEDGEYKFHPSKLGMAHEKCFNKFKSAIEFSQRVVVSNTNTTEKEFGKYKEYAEEHGYTVFVMTVENWHNGVDVHGVPEEGLQVMESRLKNSIKLR